MYILHLFIRVLDGGRWVTVGCYNGSRYKKVENHWPRRTAWSVLFASWALTQLKIKCTSDNKLHTAFVARPQKQCYKCEVVCWPAFELPLQLPFICSVATADKWGVILSGWDICYSRIGLMQQTTSPRQARRIESTLITTPASKKACNFIAVMSSREPAVCEPRLCWTNCRMTGWHAVLSRYPSRSYF